MCLGYEACLLYELPNIMDEAWPLYTAQRLHAGGTLYEDTLFIFPPGHALAAWIGYALDPPGIWVARLIYASFDAAMALVLYLLARRLMTAPFALLAVLMAVLSAPAAHANHLLFGHRYMVLSVLALVCFARRLEASDARWMFAAGLCIGTALCFRLTPAAEASVGMGLGLLATNQGWRAFGRDLLRFAGGVAVAAGPVAVVLIASVGVETLWRELVLRPAAMTMRQSLPLPALVWPEAWDRESIASSFIAIQFRAVALVFAGYAVVLAVQWIRSLRARRRFEQPLLLAVVIWGGLYFARSMVRAEPAHLASALPPACLLFAHALGLALHAGGRGFERGRAVFSAAVCAAVLAAWVVLSGSDRVVLPVLRDLGLGAQDDVAETLSGRRQAFLGLEAKLRRRHAALDERVVVLDLTATPFTYVALGVLGPGHHDIVMPGTFLDPDEEHRFVEILEQSPPETLFLPQRPFDGMPSRSLEVTAPLLARWVHKQQERAQLVAENLARERAAVAARRASARRAKLARAIQHRRFKRLARVVQRMEQDPARLDRLRGLLRAPRPQSDPPLPRSAGEGKQP
ncbi:MAG: glycosyltransferase family 39 protein [Myxococcota bacterium]